MNMKKQDIIRNISISGKEPLVNALKQMDRTGRKLLLVFDGNRFAGLVSIGDIQRALIRNTGLQEKINSILRTNIRIAGPNDSFEEIKNLMVKMRIECMPVVDSNNQLVDVFLWEDLFGETGPAAEVSLNIPVVIMAGGQGIRLKPLTNVLPKPLLPVGDKTIIEYIIERFGRIGCSHFFLSVNYKSELIKHFLAQAAADYNIEYFQEDKPLGTAGSLFLLKNKIHTSFFVTNCDILVDQDYSEIYNYHHEQKNDITLVAALKHYNIPYGTLESGDNGQLTAFREKPELTFKINTGLYILEPGTLERIPENTFFNITDLIDILFKEKRKVGVFPISENSWKDIGGWNEYMNLINGLRKTSNK